MLVTYKDVRTLTFVGKGSGGIAELASHLNADSVFYGFFRHNEKFDKRFALLVRVLSCERAATASCSAS